MRTLRGGMVGGGPGAFIGPVHRMAATLDQQASFIAGAFSRSAEKSQVTGRELGLEPSRIYDSWEEMVRAEQQRPEGERIDFVSIVTPNQSHFAIAKAFLEAGIAVVCDKPMTYSLAEALQLQEIVAHTGKTFALTHNYTGYPMVKEAKHLCAQGRLGRLLKVVVEYPQGWLADRLDGDQSAGEIWRMDPSLAGSSACMGDIGIHAENLARYITGLEMESLCAELTSFIPENRLDDDGNVLIRYRGGARGILSASQISVGEENGLNIRVYGSSGSLRWAQENPNRLVLRDRENRQTILTPGNSYLQPHAQGFVRLPPGHPEGFIEAFANIYREFFHTLRAQIEGKTVPEGDFPTVHDGVVGMAFIDAVVQSSQSSVKWHPFKY